MSNTDRFNVFTDCLTHRDPSFLTRHQDMCLYLVALLSPIAIHLNSISRPLKHLCSLNDLQLDTFVSYSYWDVADSNQIKLVFFPYTVLK